MELVANAETMSTDGHNHGRPPLPGIDGDDLQRIYYYVVWPNLLISLHPDYLMTHQVWPVEPGRSIVHCDWFFHPDTIARARLRPVRRHRLLGPDEPPGLARLRAPAARAPASRAYTPGRYSNQEDSVHAFDLMCADRYANDGRSTRAGGQGLAPPRRPAVRGVAERAARPRGDPRPRARRAAGPGGRPDEGRRRIAGMLTASGVILP